MSIIEPEEHNQNPAATAQGKTGMSRTTKGFVWFIGISLAFLITAALVLLSVFMDTSDFRNRNKY